VVTAKTERWSPEEFLRTLIEAEIGSRDESNARQRLTAARFPVTKTIDEFDLAVSSIKPATFDYLTSLEWIAARENLCLVGLPGTGKGIFLVALRNAAVDTGNRARYFTAELVEALYRGIADNRVGRVIEQILRANPISSTRSASPLDDTAAQLFFRLVAGAYERRSLDIASHWPFEDWGRFIPEHTSAVSLLDPLLHHAVIVARPRRVPPHEGGPRHQSNSDEQQDLNYPRTGDFSRPPPATATWTLTRVLFTATRRLLCALDVLPRGTYRSSTRAWRSWAGIGHRTGTCGCWTARHTPYRIALHPWRPARRGKCGAL
jgi:DNA replication protein DnaC